MLDEEEKNAALSDKKKRMWVHKCFRSRKSEGSYGRKSGGGIFPHSKFEKYLETHLGIPEDKQLPGTWCLAPHVIMSDEAFPLKTYWNLPRFAEQRGQWEKHLQLYAFLIQESGWKCIYNIEPEISDFSEDPSIIAGECGQHYFCDTFCIVIWEIKV